MEENNNTPPDQFPGENESPIGKLMKAVPGAFKITDEFVEKMKAYCDDKAVINGISDTAGYKLVAEALTKVTKYRTGIENKRKELKAPVLEYGKTIDAEAKRITALLQPIEDSLAKKKKAIDDIKAAAAKEIFDARVTVLAEAGYVFDGQFYVAGKHILIPSNITDATDEQIVQYVLDGEAETARINAEKVALAVTASSTTIGVEKRSIAWFTERVGKTVYCWGHGDGYTGEMKIDDDNHAKHLCHVAQETQHYRFEDLKTEAAAPPPAAKPTSNAAYTETMRNGTMPGLNFAAATPPPADETPAAEPGTAPANSNFNLILAGFNDCREKVLAILNYPEKMPRATLIEKIKALKP